MRLSTEFLVAPWICKDNNLHQNLNKKIEIQILSFGYVSCLIHISLPFGVFAVNSGSK